MASKLPPTDSKAPAHAFSSSNEAITATTINRLESLATASRNEVTRHLGKLAREWDLERALEANASVAGLLGLVLSYLHHRLWLLLPFLVFAFLLQHALTGFCPPVPLFRALGFRTAGEIADEGYALRLVHGLATPGVKVQEGEREKVVHEMVGNKRLKGRFVGEGPEKSAEKGERIGGEQAKAA